MHPRLARVSSFAFLFLCWAVSSSLPAVAQGQANPPGPAIGVHEVAHDVSRPLRDIEPEVPHRGPNHAIPLLHPAAPKGPGGLYADPLLQTTLGPSVSTTSGVNVDGVGNGFTGPQGTYSVGVAPPDTNGAVGDTQYVQWVNLDFAVFDKSTGTVLYGPVTGTTIWSGFKNPDNTPNACSQTNDGDVIAQYDKLANKWVMAQLSYSKAPPYLLCLAVSTTHDATGTYNRYAISYGSNLNDYPKVGVWPDGYYVTANMFQPVTFFGIVIGYNWVGPEVCGLDRTSMLTGGPSNPVCTTLSSSYSSLLPADLDGTNPPPGGSPNYLLSLEGSKSSSNILRLWKFKPNFSNGTYTLNGPTNITVASYNEGCSGGGTCIPQAGSSQQLDSLADRMMYRLAYRNQAGTEILLANHAVDTTVGGSSTVGIRWYEIHDPNGTPSLYQSGTWAPDATYRWMGSIAMDHMGDIALGYSASSGSIDPAVRYTGRLVNDPLGLGNMESENSIIEGTGSQQSGLSRWGDYSGMSVDPVDDCTFWYTTEYLKSDGTFNWNTRIASFKFPSCTSGSATPDFSLSPSPTTETVTQGTAGSFTVSVSPLNGFSSDVTLSVTSGCPTSPSNACTFSPSNVVSGGSGSQTLNVATDSTTTATTYNITISATGGGVTHTTSVSLTVNAAGNPPDFTISASPSSQTVARGKSTTYKVTIGAQNGFTGTVNLSASGNPPRTTTSFSPTSVTGSGSSTLTVKVNKPASTGTYTLTITGTSGSLVHSTTVGLTIQ